MSTYLKTAAMSLLSKTLQTFLSKYLSDVDVEGVALPSVYDGSGWGVRLSNVQLREGVELMHEMPGKVTKRRKKRKRRIRKRQRCRSDEARKRELFGVERHEEETAKQSSDGKDFTERMAATTYHENLKESAYTSEDELGYDSHDDIADDTMARPTTPVQESKSMFSCFYNNRGKKKPTISDDSLHPKDNKKALTKRNSEPGESLRGEPSNAADGNNNHHGEAHAAPRRQLFTPVTSQETSASRKEHMEQFPVTSAPLFEDVEDENGEYAYEYEEEEYEEECEVPLRLCLGENGHIGTLDVRLIGKELHVMVEDAVVTIEAIPVLEEEGEQADGDSQDDDEGQRKNENTASTGGTEKSTSNNKPTAAKKKTEPKRDTVGDRVLADNPLARLISAIPHLFLRDIRVRIIIRDEIMTVSSEDGADVTTSTDTATMAKPVSSPKDIMVEVGVDFVSVTSGDDVLSHFQQQSGVEDDSHTASLDASTRETLAALGQRSNTPPTLLRIPSYSAGAGEAVDQKNEYLVRHIRTGRGPAAGVFLRVFAPTPKLPASLSSSVAQSTLDNSGNSILWARQRWITSTENYFLQCSGLDVQARIHMGTRQVDATGYSWFGEFADEEDISEYDSMLLLAGMDTIAPGPQLPLPPMEPKMSRGNTPGRKSVNQDEATVQTELENSVPGAMHPGAEVYQTDKNGIQSCKIPSTFHRVSRGMVPGTCKNCKHLPSEVCNLCWEATDSEAPTVSSLDSSMPMPGLVLQISLRDPLEINVDRESLESLGLLKALFVKPPAKIDMAETDEGLSKGETKGGSQNSAFTSVAENNAQTASSSTGFFSSMFYGSAAEEVKEEEPTESFAAYMQPETVTVMGIFVAEICLRLHVLKEDRQDSGLSFAYWQIAMDCLTIDRHALVAKEKLYQDVELDIGRLVWDEFCGIEKKNLCTLGFPLLQMNRRRCDSQTSVASMVEDHEHSKAPWPSTACALLDIPPPLETLSYKSRERHGLQFRFLSLMTPHDPNAQARSLIHVRLGFTTVDAPLAVRHDFLRVFNGVMNNLVRVRQTVKTAEDTANDAHINGAEDVKDEQDSATAIPKSLMSYTIQLESGHIRLPPTVNIKVPFTRFCGERSSEVGISFETELAKIGLVYGVAEVRSKEECLSLNQIAALPEVARMHILLCLKDLSPLERALVVKKEKNSFRRIKAIDKGILEMAKRISNCKRDSKVLKRKSSLATTNHAIGLSRSSTSRRQEILTEIMKLKDEELSELWTVHQRYQKKLAKKRGET
jgi:hypothetical protein